MLKDRNILKDVALLVERIDPTSDGIYGLYEDLAQQGSAEEYTRVYEALDKVDLVDDCTAVLSAYANAGIGIGIALAEMFTFRDEVDKKTIEYLKNTVKEVIPILARLKAA